MSDTFSCPGYRIVEDRKIRCHKVGGHGQETFIQGIQNSCNPVFIDIGLRLGAEKFYAYFKQFGLLSLTNIDLPGEAGTIMHNVEDIGLVELATISFGQSFQVTPVQMATTVSSLVNGGYRVTPHFGVAVLEKDGTEIRKLKYKKKNGIVSEKTSETMRILLKSVVEEGSGKNGYIEGYSIGGKTATSQTLPRSANKYISSFIGFAPAEDPELIMLIQADYPNPEIGYYGSKVVTPYAQEIMEEILPYMGFYPEYTDEEAKEMNVSVPLLQDATLDTAKSTLEQLGLTYEVVGSGSSVVSQSPTTGTSIVKGGKVLLYTEQNATPDLVSVPNLVGMTASQANETMAYYGLNYALVGASASSEGALVKSQSVPEGTQIQRGSSVTLTLSAGEATD